MLKHLALEHPTLTNQKGLANQKAIAIFLGAMAMVPKGKVMEKEGWLTWSVHLEPL
jgi:hypothetical protein